MGGTIEAVGVAFSYLLGWTVYASGYTRYLPAHTPPRRLFGYAAPANFGAGLWLEVLGVAMATIFPQAAAGAHPLGLLTVLPSQALGVLALLAVILGTVTAHVLNIYSASLSALVLNVPVPRWGAALGVGIAGGVVAWLGHQHYYLDFENFLFLLAYWLAPWAAWVLADFFLIRPGRYPEGLFYDPRRRVRAGLGARIAGILCSVPFLKTGVSFSRMTQEASSHPRAQGCVALARRDLVPFYRQRRDHRRAAGLPLPKSYLGGSLVDARGVIHVGLFRPTDGYETSGKPLVAQFEVHGGTGWHRRPSQSPAHRLAKRSAKSGGSPAGRAVIPRRGRSLRSRPGTVPCSDSSLSKDPRSEGRQELAISWRPPRTW